MPFSINDFPSIQIKSVKDNKEAGEILMKEFGFKSPNPCIFIHTALVKECATEKGYPQIILIGVDESGENVSMETTARLLKGVTSFATGVANRNGLFDI